MGKSEFDKANDKIRAEYEVDLHELISDQLLSIERYGIISGGNLTDESLTPIEYRFACEWFRVLIWAAAFDAVLNARRMKSAMVLSSSIADWQAVFRVLELDDIGAGPLSIVWRSQFPIPIDKPKYRTDFAFFATVNDRHFCGSRFWETALVKLCVELDGHDYHERTAEQAKRDKNRDIQLRKFGYEVMHFTGTDVTRRANEVVGEVLDHIVFLVGDRLTRPEGSR